MKIIVEIEWDSNNTHTSHGDRVIITPYAACELLTDIQNDIKQTINTKSASEFNFEMPIKRGGYMKDVKCVWKFYSQEAHEQRSQFSKVSLGVGRRDTDL